MKAYLMIKTHRTTGLKYLCKTIQNPLKYKGSGIDWTEHLEKYGEEHDTEILRVCESKAELKEYGLYYSTLFSVVTAMDNYGNKIWANKVPENGTGWMSSETAREIQNRPEVKETKFGKNNPYFKADKASHAKATSDAMNRPEVKKRMTAENSHHYDHTVYHFIHTDGTQIDCTFFELRTKYKLHHGHLRSVIVGDRATHKGWRVKCE
jgi:hypothetical protein